eukprot:5050642-Prymnesium_polylepis.2
MKQQSDESASGRSVRASMTSSAPGLARLGEMSFTILARPQIEVITSVSSPEQQPRASGPMRDMTSAASPINTASPDGARSKST